MAGEDWICARGRLALRRMRDDAADIAQMARWLTDPRVLEFYEGRDNPFPVERIVEKYTPRVLLAEGVQPCFILQAETPAGYLQYYPLVGESRGEYHLPDDGSRIYAIDLFIGEPALWGQGIGTAVLRMTLDFLFDELGAEKVVIDPHIDNPRAVRCYEKAGFRKVGILPAHELHEGVMGDCYLMEVTRAAGV